MCLEKQCFLEEFPVQYRDIVIADRIQEGVGDRILGKFNAL